jgi:putative endonuclease
MGDRRQSERQGRGAETLAMIYLRLTGHRIVAHRWRGRSGEIDIVARRHRVIIFCEVKFRRHPDESGIPSPQQRKNSHPGSSCPTAPNGASTLSRFRHLSVPDYGLFAI